MMNFLYIEKYVKYLRDIFYLIHYITKCLNFFFISSLTIRKAQNKTFISDNNLGDTDETRRCLSDLIETLQARMSAIKKAKASWKYLLPAAKNLTISEPVNFDNLIMQSGTVDSIEIATEEDILPPHQIAKALDELDRTVHDIQARHSKSQQEIIANMLTEGKITVNDVYLEELEIDQMRVDVVNDVDMKSEKMILQEGEQHFTQPLRAKSLIVHDLEVESLCGITPECKFDKNFGQFLRCDISFYHIDLCLRRLDVTK